MNFNKPQICFKLKTTNHTYTVYQSWYLVLDQYHSSYTYTPVQAADSRWYYIVLRKTNMHCCANEHMEWNDRKLDVFQD